MNKEPITNKELREIFTESITGACQRVLSTIPFTILPGASLYEAKHYYQEKPEPFCTRQLPYYTLAATHDLLKAAVLGSGLAGLAALLA